MNLTDLEQTVKRSEKEECTQAYILFDNKLEILIANNPGANAAPLAENVGWGITVAPYCVNRKCYRNESVADLRPGAIKCGREIIGKRANIYGKSSLVCGACSEMAVLKRHVVSKNIDANHICMEQGSEAPGSSNPQPQVPPLRRRWS